MGSLSLLYDPVRTELRLSDRWPYTVSRILWYIEVFMADSMTARCPGPLARKQTQIIIPLPLWLIVDIRCFCRYVVLVFPKCGAVHYGRTSPLLLICPKDILPEVLSFVQMQLWKPKPCCHCLFRVKRLFPGSLPNKPYI